MRALILALALTLALTVSVVMAGAAQAQPGPALTTLCIGLPECEPGGQPAPPSAPDPLLPANAALERGDHAAALRLLTPLAQGGSAEAQYRLGDLYYKGQGAAQDYLAAGKWYGRAAEQLGSEWAAEAQVNLGLMHAAGQGLPADGVGALMWLEIAAACGSDLALQEREIYAARLIPEQAGQARALARDWLAARGR